MRSGQCVQISPHPGRVAAPGRERSFWLLDENASESLFAAPQHCHPVVKC